MQENNNEKRDKIYKNIFKEVLDEKKKDIEKVLSAYNHLFRYINFEKIKVNENSYTITNLVIDFENLKKATKEIEYLTALLEENKEKFQKAIHAKEVFECFINSLR